MTHRERIIRTFDFQPTDRLACDLMEGLAWAELLDYFRVRQGCADALAVQQVLDTDCRWVWMATRDPAPPTKPKPVPAAPPPAAARAYSREVSHGPLAGARTVAEVEAYPWDDPSRWVPPDFAQARRQWPDHALVFIPGWWPLFWTTCDVFGVEDALVNLATEPALFEAAVRCIHERYLDRLTRGLAAARGHADICWLGDDFASQQSMFLSPELWRRYIKPCLAEQVAVARQHGLRVLYHSCGAVRPVLGDLIDIGVNGLLVFQTTAAGMDAASIAREFGGRMVFYGGMDIQRLLSFGTADEVEAEVRKNAQAFRNCGGYIVANSHHGVATINGANMEAMYAAARKAVCPFGPLMPQEKG